MNNNRRGLIVSLALILPLVLCSVIFAEGVVVELKREVKIDGTDFRLGDIATIKADDPATLQLLNNMCLGAIPDLETGRKNITPAEILLKMHEAGIKPPDISFSGATVATIKPNVQTISPETIVEQVKNCITDNMPWDKDDIIFEPVRMPEAVEVTRGAVSFEVAPISRNQYIGQVKYSTIISVDGKVEKHIDVTLRLTVFKKVLVALNGIKRGEMLTPKNVAFIRREISSNTQDAISDPKLAIGLVAGRNISAQGIIKESYLQMPCLVRTKELVRVVFQSKNLSIETVGLAKESGTLGDVIRVLNIDSKEIFYAQVVGVRTVAVNDLRGKL